MLIERNRLAVGLELTADVIAGAGDDVLSIHHRDLRHRHLVLGQCAGLIGADDRRRTEGLHGRQAANESMAFHHLLHPQRQADGHHSGQALGNRSDRQADRNHEELGDHGNSQRLAGQNGAQNADEEH